MGEPIAGLDAGVRDYRYTLLAKQLAAQGHEVVRWSSTFEHILKKFRALQNTTVDLQPRLKVRLLHGEPAYYRNISLARFRQQRAVARLFVTEAGSWPSPDLIYTGIPVPDWSDRAVRFGRERGIPVVVDAQDQWPDIYVAAFPRSLRWLGRVLLAPEFARCRRIFRRATSLTAVSETYLQWALRLAGRPAKPCDGVYPLGFAPPQLQEAPSEQEKALLREQWHIPAGTWVASFLGTFGNFYDIETIVRTAHLLHEKKAHHIHVVMAGDGEKMPVARALAAGVPTITVPGWIEHATTLTLNALSSVGLCAYARRAFQSIPYKPLEYMAARLPLISSLPGEMRQIIEGERCGIYYEAGNPESLCSCMLELAAQPDRCAEMGRRSRDLFDRRFDARVIYPRLAGQLERLALEHKNDVGV